MPNQTRQSREAACANKARCSRPRARMVAQTGTLAVSACAVCVAGYAIHVWRMKIASDRQLEVLRLLVSLSDVASSYYRASLREPARAFHREREAADP